MPPSLARKGQLEVSHTSVYNKIDGIEPDVSAPLVRYSARQLAPVIEQLGGKKPDEGTRQIFSRPRAGPDADLRNTSTKHLSGRTMPKFTPKMRDVLHSEKMAASTKK